MNSFEKLSGELTGQGKAEDIKRIAQSPEGIRLGRMIDSAAVEKAAQSGDSEALKNILSRVLATEDGRKLAENVRKMMEK